ncbi:MAG: type I glyceraldehyde-3-phosphate dehydrogenase [Candidatus Sungbacteria bacterium RIFCSPLOWO2_01_FULL_59_16]|uniref:Type I glyceraldehyde-3-phosphate dehydrogenase n=1 Tax=Candidatus Sungbacteria bacterium RIFCSPLOWO2_01_FULL_59_16 TaxID=1802280 RepID=A0A1G2LAS4_9BACT|nr:MAG: type I glyceraldehyde-3-phosphate dehydrogenase [Candidatus Sungbacteria bacterium RIFCSPLOWO2_01_FULL_59_16]
MAKIAINGFGRIGRSFFRAAFGLPEFEIVALNDLVDPGTLAYLLKFDSVYGRYARMVNSTGKEIVVDDYEIPVLAEKDPVQLPWKKLGVDIVVESTGFFTDGAKARMHIDAGAKRVVITAPATGDVTTALIGANDDRFKKPGPITANASCTTNSVVPVLAILEANFGLAKAIMNTVHGYTATQKLVDGPDMKDPRRGRAAAANIVPSTTGAAEAVIQSLPFLKGKFDAVAIRVPVIAGSLSVVNVLLEKNVTTEEVNAIFEQAAKDARWARVLKVTDAPVVSTDIVGEPYGAIIDLGLTRVSGGNLATVFSWYDNEAGYTATLVEHVRRIAGML